MNTNPPPEPTQTSPPTPPPPPNVVYVNSAQNSGNKNSSARVLSIISIVMVGIGILPLLFQLLLVLDRNGLAVLTSIIGLLVHGTGAVFGVVGMALGAKFLAAIGIAGNCIIAIITFLSLFLWQI